MRQQRSWHRLRSPSCRRAAPAWPENSTRIQVQHGYLLLLFTCNLPWLQHSPDSFCSLLLLQPFPATFAHLLHLLTPLFSCSLSYLLLSPASSYLLSSAPATTIFYYIHLLLSLSRATFFSSHLIAVVDLCCLLQSLCTSGCTSISLSGSSRCLATPRFCWSELPPLTSTGRWGAAAAESCANAKINYKLNEIKSNK